MLLERIGCLLAINISKHEPMWQRPGTITRAWASDGIAASNAALINASNLYRFIHKFSKPNGGWITLTTMGRVTLLFLWLRNQAYSNLFKQFKVDGSVLLAVARKQGRRGISQCLNWKDRFYFYSLAILEECLWNLIAHCKWAYSAESATPGLQPRCISIRQTNYCSNSTHPVPKYYVLFSTLPEILVSQKLFSVGLVTCFVADIASIN